MPEDLPVSNAADHTRIEINIDTKTSRTRPVAIDARIRRGKVAVLVMIAVLLGISVLAITVRLISIGPDRLPSQMIRLGLTGVLLLNLYGGHNWARVMTTLLAFGGIVFSLVALIGGGQQVSLLLMCIAGLFVSSYGAIAVALLFSPSVNAFLKFQRQECRATAAEKIAESSESGQSADSNPKRFPCPECGYSLPRGYKICMQCDWRHEDLDFA